MLNEKHNISSEFGLSEHAVVYPGNCLDLLKTIPAESLQLIVTEGPKASQYLCNPLGKNPAKRLRDHA